MSALHERLGAAIDTDATRFSGEDFARDRRGSVVGSVRRRRAARAGGVGSATVLSAGALAVGAANVPWGSFVFGAAPGAPSVLCTTTTPDAADSATTAVPEDATFVVIDDATEAVFFVGWPGLKARAWDASGARVELTRVSDEESTLALPSGISVAVRAEGIDNVKGVTIVPASGFVGLPAAAADSSTVIGLVPGANSWLLTDAVSSDPLAKATLDGTTLVLNTFEGEDQRIEPDAEGVYRFEVGGKSVEWTVDSQGGEFHFLNATTATVEVRGVATAPSPSPSVVCVTQSPAPSEQTSDSATPAPTGTPTAASTPSTTPSATPSPRITFTGDPTLSSPFACGFVFASDEYGTDQLALFGAPTTNSAIRKTFDEWYGNEAPTTEVGDTGATAYHAVASPAELKGATSTRDPASPQSVQTSKAYDIPSLGVSFVAVRDGVVVATVVPGGEGETPGVVVDRDGEGNPEEAFLWDLDALTPCGSASIEGADIFAVAGYGSDGDVLYSWKNVSE